MKNFFHSFSFVKWSKRANSAWSFRMIGFSSVQFTSYTHTCGGRISLDLSNRNTKWHFDCFYSKSALSFSFIRFSFWFSFAGTSLPVYLQRSTKSSNFEIKLFLLKPFRQFPSLTLFYTLQSSISSSNWFFMR